MSHNIGFYEEISKIISSSNYHQISSNTHLICTSDLSRVMRKPTFWFPTWSDTNRAVQLQKMARGLKFRI